MASTASDVLDSEIGRYILSNLASVEDDLSDVSIYHQKKNPTSVTEYVLLDISDGPKTMLTAGAFGCHPYDTAATNPGAIGPVTVDGQSNSVYPSSATGYWSGDTAGDNKSDMVGYPIRYDDSLRVEWEHNGSGEHVTVFAHILGSGPHSIAVVKDGKPVYMTAENLSEATIGEMNVPSGYKIVKNPEIDHPNPQTRGAWDDDKGKVVDHPYWEPFHDTLDKLDGMRRRAGSQSVLEKIERNPTSFENMLEGENPMEDPVEEAVQFWYEREKERTTGLSELKEIRGDSR